MSLWSVQKRYLSRGARQESADHPHSNMLSIGGFLMLVPSCVSPAVSPAPAEDLFKGGSAAYIAGGLERSPAFFGEAATAGGASATPHNLGNAGWQGGRSGGAIFPWERA